MQRTIGGLTPAEPGYRRIEISPRPGGGLTHAHTRHLTPYGLLECNWKIANEQFDLEVTIPPNATARIILPVSDSQPIEIGSGVWRWSAPYQDPDARGSFTADDLVGDIMSDNAARDVIFAVLDRVGAPGFLKAILANERSIVLRQVLQMLPNYEEAVEMMNAALAGLGK
jgi:alpha-L-rhamnosidase